MIKIITIIMLLSLSGCNLPFGNIAGDVIKETGKTVRTGLKTKAAKVVSNDAKETIGKISDNKTKRAETQAEVDKAEIKADKEIIEAQIEANKEQASSRAKQDAKIADIIKKEAISIKDEKHAQEFRLRALEAQSQKTNRQETTKRLNFAEQNLTTRNKNKWEAKVKIAKENNNTNKNLAIGFSLGISFMFLFVIVYRLAKKNFQVTNG